MFTTGTSLSCQDDRIADNNLEKACWLQTLVYYLCSCISLIILGGESIPFATNWMHTHRPRKVMIRLLQTRDTLPLQMPRANTLLPLSRAYCWTFQSRWFHKDLRPSLSVRSHRKGGDKSTSRTLTAMHELSNDCD